MRKFLVYVFLSLFLTGAGAFAAGKSKTGSDNADNRTQEEGQAKEISGISIVGNNEAPTSLVIVPWKSSEIGQETKLKSNLLDDGLTPVDRAVFMRELGFYKLSNPN
jgi:hypothetical protein